MSDFSQPQRQNLLGVLVYFAKNGRAFFSLFIVLLATSRGFENGSLYLGLGIGVLVLLITVVSYLQYLKFTFHIEDEELIIHKGVLFTEKRIIPFDRIQSVHIHQNFIQQILNVVGLKIDSAGSRKKELEISALDQRTARALQSVLQNGEVSKSEEPIERPAVQSTELLRLDVGDLLKIGLTENHLRSGLLAIAVVWGYYSQYRQYLEDYLEDYVPGDLTEYLPEIIRMGMVMVLTGMVLFIIISVVLSLIRTVLRFFNFRAWLETSMIGISSGLLKRNEYRIPVSKVQYLVWNSNPLRKILGFESINVRQAQSANEQRQQAIEIPACYPPQTHAIEQAVFGREVNMGQSPVRPNILPYILITLYVSVFITAVLLIWSYLHGKMFIGSIGIIPVFLFFAWQYGKSIRIDLQADLLIIKKGWIFPRRYVLPLYKAQSVAMKQSIFLKRRGLANFIFYTASGKVGVRFLDEGIVRSLYNFVLFRTESHQGSWM